MKLHSELIKEISRYLDAHGKDIERFLKRLIGFRSTNTGMYDQGREHNVQNWLKTQFQDAGLDRVDLWSVDPKKNRPNLVGTIKGKGSGKALILQAHCDVVPVHKEDERLWRHSPWKATNENGLIYGRGASDDKGGLTAIFWAAKAIRESGINLSGDLYIQSVIGEESMEGKTIGAAATIRRGYSAPFAVIAEPTGCEIQTQSFGVFVFELLIQGKPVHACARDYVLFPDRYQLGESHEIGVDAILKGTQLVQILRQLEDEWNTSWKDEVLDLGGYPLSGDEEKVRIFTMNPSFIEGGTYMGTVPSICRLTYVVSHPNTVPSKQVKEGIQQAIREGTKDDEWLKHHPPQFIEYESEEWEASKVSIKYPGNQVLARSFQEITGSHAVYSGFRGASDATFMGQKGVPSVLFGPGAHMKMIGIHGIDECVSIDQVVTCAKVYAAMAINWCGLDRPG